MLEILLLRIADFASLDCQYREWICDKTNPYGSFNEWMCLLYDNSHFEDILDRYKNQFDFTEQQYRALDEFRKALNHYIDVHCAYKDDEDIVKDPHWHKVVEKAQLFFEVFKDYDLKNGKEFIE